MNFATGPNRGASWEDRAGFAARMLTQDGYSAQGGSVASVF